MPPPGQPPPSPALEEALRLLAAGDEEGAEKVVTKAAKRAKGDHGSGTHPLAKAYADMARLHARMGTKGIKRAAAEFRHACGSPLPPDPDGRADRLAFMTGYAWCVAALGGPAEAAQVFRQCVAFARNLHGPGSVGHAAALLPLADHLLATDQPADALKAADEAFDLLWRHGDARVAEAVAVRAEARAADAAGGDPFADLDGLPPELVAATAAAVLGRRWDGDGPTRAAAVRWAVRTYAESRVPAGLLADLEVGFDPDGAVHLSPHLGRNPSPAEAATLEAVLNAAVDDLYSRQTR